MSDVQTCPPPIIQKYRTRLASIWLARNRATASDVVKVMIGEGSITIHSARSAELLLRFDWTGDTIVIETAEPDRLYKFADLEASLKFIDAILLNCIHPLSDTHSLAPASLMDEAFWHVDLKRDVVEGETGASQKLDVKQIVTVASTVTVPAPAAASDSWVNAWAL